MEQEWPPIGGHFFMQIGAAQREVEGRAVFSASLSNAMWGIAIL
jgi:hypothetical protein